MKTPSVKLRTMASLSPEEREKVEKMYRLACGMWRPGMTYCRVCETVDISFYRPGDEEVTEATPVPMHQFDKVTMRDQDTGAESVAITMDNDILVHIQD